MLALNKVRYYILSPTYIWRKLLDRMATQSSQVGGVKRNVAQTRRSGIWPNYIIAMLYCVLLAGWLDILAYFMFSKVSEFCQHALTPAMSVSEYVCE